MRKTGQNYLLQLTRLLGNCRNNPRIGMTVQIHPPGRYRINDLAPIRGVQEDAFGPRHANRRRVEDTISEGMPDLKWRIHCANADRSKWFRNTCMRAVRWRLGSFGISP